MKKKATILILLFLCIVVWGTIGWKVYSALQEETPVLVASVKAPAPKAQPDTLALLLDYRDPFLGGYPQQRKQVEETSLRQAVDREVYAEQPQEEVIPDFEYKGVVRMGQTTQAIVSRHGENLMVKVNEKVGEFSVLKITDNTLLVSRKNKQYELPIQ